MTTKENLETILRDPALRTLSDILTNEEKRTISLKESMDIIDTDYFQCLIEITEKSEGLSINLSHVKNMIDKTKDSNDWFSDFVSGPDYYEGLDFLCVRKGKLANYFSNRIKNIEKDSSAILELKELIREIDSYPKSTRETKNYTIYLINNSQLT